MSIHFSSLLQDAAACYNLLKLTLELLTSASHDAGGTSTSQAAPRLTGLSMAQSIIQREGLRGLYRGFGLSVVTFVPSSAVWWSAYGGYQKAIWHMVFSRSDAAEVMLRLREICTSILPCALH